MFDVVMLIVLSFIGAFGGTAVMAMVVTIVRPTIMGKPVMERRRLMLLFFIMFFIASLAGGISGSMGNTYD